MTAVPVAAGPTASARVARLMAVSLGAAGLILLGLAVPTILGESHALAPWWTVTAIVLVAGASVTVIVAGAIGSRRETTIAFLVLAGVILLGALITPFAAPPGSLAFDPWLNDLTVLGAAAAAAGLPVPAAIGYLVVTLGAYTANAMLLADAGFRAVLLLHHSQSVFYAALFAALAIASRRAGRLLDDAVRSAVAEVSAAAAAEARRAQRRRVEALIHDRLIVALLAFGRGDRGNDERAVREAVRALQAIEELEEPAPVGDPTARELAWRLQAMTTELDARIRFDYVAGMGRIPARVAAAAEEAMSEAVRNSLRHAGERVSRQVSVDVDERRVRVVVLDDGNGFEPGSVEPTRLGISQGIVHRLALVGGRAEVISRAGRGTTVVLEWTPA
jgi:hypothetical protein